MRRFLAFHTWRVGRDALVRCTRQPALIRPLLILAVCWTTPHVTWSREQCVRMRSERHVRALPPRRTVCGAAVVNDDRSSNADQYTGAGSMVVVIEKGLLLLLLVYQVAEWLKLPQEIQLMPYVSSCTLCLKKRPTFTIAVIFTYTVRLRQFLAQMLPRKQAIKMYFTFPPHLASASALPGKTGNPEIASFHLNVACFYTTKHETQLKISPGQSWTTLHCQNNNNRLDAPDRTWEGSIASCCLLRICSVLAKSVAVSVAVQKVSWSSSSLE